MSEKFSKLFSLEKNLYAESVPIIIKDGMLLKDTDNNKLLIQLQMLNISKQVINAVKFKIIGYDTFEQQVCTQEFQYIDLTVQQDGEFGSQTMLVVDDQTVRSFTVELVQVLFDDKTGWYGKGEKFVHIPDNVTIKGYVENKKFKTTMRKYDEALELLSTTDVNYILEVQKIFEELGEFEDSAKQIKHCEDKIKAIKAMGYHETKNVKLQKRNTLIIGSLIIVFCVLIVLFFIATLILKFVEHYL